MKPAFNFQVSKTLTKQASLSVKFSEAAAAKARCQGSPQVGFSGRVVKVPYPGRSLDPDGPASVKTAQDDEDDEE